LLRQLATTIKIQKKLSKNCQKIVKSCQKVVKKLSKSCQKVPQHRRRKRLKERNRGAHLRLRGPENVQSNVEWPSPGASERARHAGDQRGKHLEREQGASQSKDRVLRKKSGGDPGSSGPVVASARFD
jgi:hypothetical protein